MQVRNRHHWNRGRARRAAVVVPLLVAMVLSTLGVAVPLRPKKGDGTPFPCQSHDCGCETAVQCREACCCFTPVQQAAWNQKHGVVTTPAEVSALTEPAGNETSVCHAAGEPEGDRCSGKQTSGCARCRDSRTAPSAPPYPAWAPRKCRGLTPLWTMLGEVVPFHRDVEWHYGWDSAGRLQCIAATRIEMSFPPPVPPPRG